MCARLRVLGGTDLFFMSDKYPQNTFSQFYLLWRPETAKDGDAVDRTEEDSPKGLTKALALAMATAANSAA